MNLLEVDLEKLFTVLGTDPELGLSEDQALRNRREFGENVLFDKKNTVSAILKRTFGDVMMIVLLLTSLVDFIVSGNAASFLVLLFTALAYFAYSVFCWRYIRAAEKQVERVCRNKYRVRRGGRVRTVHKSEIVSGDLLLLEKGDVCPADGLILRQKGLRILEAGVTGRRVPVFKRSHAEVRSGAGYPYFECILFAGSVLLQGQAEIFVCNVGRSIFDNENFTISRQNTFDPQICRTALYLKKQISLVWVLACFLLFAWGVFRGVGVFEIFYFTVALALAALPDSIESLCDLGTAYMIRKMEKEGAILRNPGAVDRLGDVNAVFVNSGDFLFYTQPMADSFYAGDTSFDFDQTPEKARSLLEHLVLVQPDREEAKNLPSRERRAERAFQRAAASIGVQPRRLKAEFLSINHYPFDPKFGYSAALLLRENRYRLVVRGNFESVLAASTMIERDGVVTAMNEGDRIRLAAFYKSMAARCETIVTVAYRSLTSPSTGDQRELAFDMTFLGFFGLSTPLSAAAAKAVSTCQKSGIGTYLMTDDYPETVAAVSQSVSIIGEEDYPYALEYRSYQRMDKGVFVADLARYKAFSSFPAEEKQNVIRFHKEDGDIVASLSGGLYDTLPQMESDVSIVSADERFRCTKLNSDVLLKEKRFDLVPFCINWARTFYRNVVHVMQFSLVLQVALFLIVFIGLSASGDTVFPILPMLLCSLTVSLPAGINLIHRGPGLKLEKVEGVLSRDRVYSWQALLVIPAVIGTAAALAVMMAYRAVLYLSGSAASASGAAILAFSVAIWTASLSMKFDDLFFRSLKLLGKTEAVSFGALVLSVLLTVYSPFANLYRDGFAGAGISFGGFLFSVLIALVPFALSELMKLLRAESEKAPAPAADPAAGKKAVEKEEEDYDFVYDDENEEEEPIETEEILTEISEEDPEEPDAPDPAEEPEGPAGEKAPDTNEFALLGVSEKAKTERRKSK